MLLLLVFLNPYERVEVARRNLPHWRQEGVVYFVTFRIGDSVPLEKLTKWKEERLQWLKNHGEPFSEEEAKEFHERFTSRMERWLDRGMGSCVLREKGQRDRGGRVEVF